MKIYDYSGRANISGDRIHQARTAQRLSQDVLAAKMQVYGVGLGREAISRIETGDRFVTDYELAIFARVLGVSLVWLTGDLEQFPVAASSSRSPSDHFRDATKMIPAARCFTAADLAASRSLSRIRERPPVPYYSRPPFSPSAAA